MIKIIIADDHAIVRQGLKLILDETIDMEIVAEVSSGDDLMEKIYAGPKNYDIVILDIAMPGKDTIDTLKEIRTGKTNIPVLILSMNPEKLYAVRLLKAGASGYISKDSNPKDIIEAIWKVAGGGMYISQTLSELLASDLRSGSDKPVHETLTDREFQIMCLIASGQTLPEISEKLFLSKNTISNHRNNILKKMTLRNNSEISIYAMKNKLLD